MTDVKRVYTFGNKEAEGNGKMRELLGGKGANLAEMNLIGIPVPPGFTITTEVCAEYYRHGKQAIIERLSRPWPSVRAIPASHGIRTAASYRCTAMWCWA